MRYTIPILIITETLLVGCHSPSMFGDNATNHPNSGIEKPPKLEIKVTKIFNLDEKKFGIQKGTQVDAVIRNVGETTVFLPTKVFQSVCIMSGVHLITFTPDVYLSTPDGFRIPQAKSDLAIVELRPREAVSLSCILTDTNVAPTNVSVSYSVSKEFAERYGTWHGEISPVSRNPDMDIKPSP